MKILNLIQSLFSKNYNAYLTFLVLTFVLWFSIQLVKSYTFSTDIKIQLVNIPNHVVVDTTVKSIGITLKTNGFKLWTYNLSDKKITLSFKDLKKDTLHSKVNSTELKKKIRNRYGFKNDNIEIQELFISFGYRKKTTKKIPVKVDADLSFKSGYNTLDNIKIKPDSVVISGPNNELKNIDYIRSEKLILKNIKDTLSGKIDLKMPSDKIKASVPDVNYFLPVEKFSEKTLMVDIETVNVPDSLQLSTYPNKAKVSFLVSLKSYDKISDLDFQVVCDYKKRYEEDAIMIPQLVKSSEIVLNPKLQINKVDYLVKQKP
ncbi:CdaR family protein [Mesohalobacter halotolerans]|uniref:YbbR-like domain-containing protein n=1 Tax=Mesohalobacter halotolerans TaxID=1883405 RepID=A0A4U5TQ58_9FLAO|nr:YbbR-like domain-containing protein [Mesohalobacter halotolerans]TKS56156.1 hypothetical protein FCN74_09080 [Mesohalobacter halotolerans]